MFLCAKQLLCTCITLFSTFLWRPLHAYDVKPPNATFRGGRGHMKTNFPFSIWTWIKSLTFQLQEKSPTFAELSGSKIDALKTERTQTHFLVMFSLPSSSSSSMLKVPICTMTSYYDQQNFSVCCFFVQSGAIFLNLSQGWKDLFTVLAPRTKTKTTGIELTHTCIIPHASALVFVVQEKCRSR